MIIFVLMNLIVIASSFLINYKLIRLSGFIDSLISWFLLYFAQIIFSELVLGIRSILYLNNLILLNVAIFLIIWLITKNREFYFGLSDIKGTTLSLLDSKIVILLISVIAGFGLVKFFINALNPPFGWDSLNYHFTFPVEWLKHGNLDMPITISDDPSPSYYPINGSLFFLWLIFPFKSVFLADLGQIPFFILAYLAVYSIARKISLDKELSFYAAALFILIPNFFKQLQIAYVDVMVAGLFLTCVNYLFALNESFSWQNVLMYSLSAGLLLGTKTLALPYTMLLFIPFLYLLFKNIKKSHLFLLFIFTILILGGFSYIRNFLETGNPLYPLDFKLFDKTILKGVMDSITYRARFNLHDYRLSKILFHEGLGLQTLIFILPSVFLALPITLIKRKKNINFNLTYFLTLPVLIYLVYRYIIPLANTRYLYPLLGIGMIIGFYTFDMFNIPRKVINILIIVSILASASELAKRQELISSLVLTVLLYLLILLMKKIKIVVPVKTFLFIILSVIITLSILALLEKYYIRNEYPRYAKMVKYSGFWPDATKAWAWLNQNTSGNNIAYAGRPVPFPLYGTNFKNNVYYVSVNKIDPVKLHYFPNSHYQWDSDFLNLHRNLEADGNYRSRADYSVWWNNLLKRNTDYLFIYSLHQTKNIEFPLEDKWATDNSGRFVPVFTNETIHIYRVVGRK